MDIKSKCDPETIIVDFTYEDRPDIEKVQTVFVSFQQFTVYYSCRYCVELITVYI